MRVQLSLSTHAQETLCIRHFYKICCAKKSTCPAITCTHTRKHSSSNTSYKLRCASVHLAVMTLTLKVTGIFLHIPCRKIQPCLLNNTSLLAAFLQNTSWQCIIHFLPTYIWNVYCTCFWPLGFSTVRVFRKPSLNHGSQRPLVRNGRTCRFLEMESQGRDQAKQTSVRGEIRKQARGNTPPGPMRNSNHSHASQFNFSQLPAHRNLLSSGTLPAQMASKDDKPLERQPILGVAD